MMKLISYEQAETFLDATLDALLKDEEQNNLIVGIADRIRKGRRYGDDPPIFLAVHDDRQLAAAAIRTPPHNLILYCNPETVDALDSLVKHLAGANPDLPGVSGTVPMTSAFAERWNRRTGAVSHVGMSQRIYSLRQVVPPSEVSGNARWAREDDVPTLVKWFLNFCQEATPHDPPTNPEENVRRFMDSGKLAVWEDDGIVSMAASSRGTPNGGTVSAVYTPPEHRGHGYASACVAALSQAILDDGFEFCTLYTDLSNPTSNKIYQSIGYRPVVDCSMIQFDKAEIA